MQPSKVANRTSLRILLSLQAGDHDSSFFCRDAQLKDDGSGVSCHWMSPWKNVLVRLAGILDRDVAEAGGGQQVRVSPENTV